MTVIGPAESADPVSSPLPSLETLAKRDVERLRRLRLGHHGDGWLLDFRDINDRSLALTSVETGGSPPGDLEIAALLAEHGLTMRDSGWEAWHGEEKHRYRSVLIAPHKLNEALRREAAGNPPRVRSSAELAWSDWLTLIGAVAALFAAVDRSGASSSLVRFVLCGVSTALFVLSIRRRRYLAVYPLFLMASVWNPVVPVHFSRGVWVVLDLVAAAIFIAMFIGYRRRKNPPGPTR